MIYILFDILILTIIGVSFKNFGIGYLLALCSYMVIPSMVRIQLGGIGFSIVDVIPLSFFLLFLVNRRLIKNGIKFPKKLKLYFYISIISTFILILFSSGFVPIQTQFINLFKYVIQTILFLYLGYYAFYSLDKRLALNILLYCSILCGLYGILTYFLHTNPYINSLYLFYTGEENIYMAFQESIRGALEGRVSGTNVHPLGWGQMWNVLLPFFIIVRKDCNRILFSFVILIGVINIVLCGSRSALIGFLLFLLFFLFFEKKSTALKYTLVGFGFLLLTFVVFDNYRPINQMKEYLISSIAFWDTEKQSQMDIKGSSMEMRLEQFDVATKIAFKNLGGEGYGYKLYSLQHYSQYNSDLYGLESFVIRELVEKGWLGLICFLWMFYLLYSYAISEVNAQDKYKWFAYFISFFICILMTDIQGISWTLFFLLILLNKVSKRNYLIKNTAI